jgi:hypothetical protein
MDLKELKALLAKLKAEHRKATDEAAAQLTEEEPNLESVRELNDQAEGIRERITELERTLESIQAEEDERAAAEAAAAAEAEAEVEALAEEKARAMLKKVGLDRPDFTKSEGEEDEEEIPDIPEHMSRIQVASRYDEMGTLDLAMEYYIKSRAARVGAASSAPTLEMYRALAVKAAAFVRSTDKLPRRNRYGETKMVEVPAFNPREFEKEMRWRDEPDTYTIGGREVKFNDNVSMKGIKSLWELGIKANEVIHTTQAGYGDEWVPTLASAALWRTIRMDARVLASLSQFDMPSQPYQYSAESADPTFYNVGETTAEAQLVIGANMPIGDSKVGTARITFTAGKIGALSFWSEEMNEDSIIPTEPQLRDQFGIAVAHNVDSVLLNGDETTGGTSNISYYGATPSVESFLAVDGLRHAPLVTTTADSRDGGVLNLSDVNATRKLMGTAGINGGDVSQLVIFCDIPTGMTFEDLDEVTTVDKYGAQATVLNGELGNIKGIPIIKSQDYGLTYTNGNVHSTGSNNTKGSFVIVNRMGVKVGWRRRPRIYVGQIPFSDAWYILALTRFDVGFLAAGMVGMTYNITV